MNIEEIKTFIILAETKSFSKTAQKTHLVQSTVSNRIKALESTLDVKLFDRNTKTVKLTSQGEDFLVYANRLLAIYSDALVQLQSDVYYNNILNIALTHSIYDLYLDKMLIHYSGLHEKNAVKININHSISIIQNILDGITDIGFVHYHYPSSKLHHILFKEDRVVLVTVATNTKFLKGITVKDLKSVQMLYSDIIPEEHYEWFNTIFPSNYVFKLQINILGKIIPFIKETSGYCFLPYALVQDAISNQELIEIPLLDTTPPPLNYYLVVKENRLKETLIDQFLEFIT